MADVTEKIFVVNLRREWIKEPRSNKLKRSIATLRQFGKKNFKVETVALSKGVNDLLCKTKPSRVKIRIIREKDRILMRLPDEKIEEPKKVKKSLSQAVRGLAKPGQAGKKPEEAKPQETKKPEIKEAKEVVSQTSSQK